MKAKKSADDVEESIAKIRAMDAMESEVDRIHEISKIADAFNAGPIRKRAIAATLDAMEREVDRVAKLGGGGTYAPFNNRVSYPHGQGETVLQSNRTVSPGSSTTFPDRSQRRVTPVVQNVGRHQFDNLVDATRARDGGSRLKAFTTARLENPGVYESYQNWHSGNTTQEQRSVQQETNNPVNKSAPTTSYDDLVNVEIRKGHSPRVAQQRVAQLYGLLPDETIAKAEDNYQQLKDVAQGLLDEGDSMPRTSALRKARLSNEGLYKRLNAI